jgi:hypothetical protein
MSIMIKTCVEVTCDVCGIDCFDAWDAVPHFASIEDAMETLGEAEWRLTDNHARQLCNDCAKHEDCARNGHLMASWQDCLCQWDHIAIPATSPCGHRWRYCAHCDGAYERTGPESAIGSGPERR